MSAEAAPRPTIDDLVTGARFLARLPAFLRRPLRLEEARAELEHRFRTREAHLLDLSQRAIYENPFSPYRRLLERVGCEYGDLERLVRLDGVEGALHHLYCQGVYLTVAESKGRRPVIRGSDRFDVGYSDLRNPRLTTHMVGQTGGSRGPSASIAIDLTTIRETGVDGFLRNEVCELQDQSRAIWAVPGSQTIRSLLRSSLWNAPIARWFSPVDPATAQLHPRYRWSERVLRLGGFLAGTSYPHPVFVPLDDPLPIARWMAEEVRSGGRPHLSTYASNAVRISQAALAAGLDLHGAELGMSGEPVTAARVAAVERTGAETSPLYASNETGTIGFDCRAREEPDEVHLLHHRLAVIQPGEDANCELPPSALLATSLLPNSRLILFNVSLGDQAEMVRRSCGCPLDQLGWTTHLHSVRSFEKLTAGGMTFLDADVLRVLEEALPARFGGGPIDYQLVDEEMADGSPRMRLLVHPRLGPLHEEEVRRFFLDAIGPGNGPERVMALMWRDAHLPIVERIAPRTTGSGKIQHVHLRRSAELVGAGSNDRAGSYA